ncbi:FAD-dependent oxidoreductase [Streptomyces sp. NPDC005202]|uniref:protoporphyrinogen/coproporphyrinogen oxidase n=1 Tax=Streptomyces sp. NPDC005202 TaxID=3157021 RepID=UPI00339E0EAB
MVPVLPHSREPVPARGSGAPPLAPCTVRRGRPCSSRPAWWRATTPVVCRSKEGFTPHIPHPLRSDRVVILGAGPCGLACADELKRLGHRDFTLLEAAPVAGGLAASVVDAAGFTWDLGGHVVFSHFGEFDRLLAELFAPGELLHHDRSSFVRFRDRWVPYPFQQHLHHLPAEDAEACVHDLLLACQRREQDLPAEADFATWLHGMYGSGLVDWFFGPYNSKFWAMTPEQMASSWVAERVAPVDAGEIMAAFSGTAASPARRWGPNATFAFPARGGTGEIWRRLAARLDGDLRTGARVVAVDPATRTVALADGQRIGYHTWWPPARSTGSPP